MSMREDSTAVRCYPPSTPLWQWPIIVFLTFVVFGGIISLGLVSVADLITHYQTTQQTKFILLGIAGAISIVLLWIFARWDRDRWYWVLEADRLIGGKKQNHIFPLSSITTIVPGLPEKINPLAAASEFVNPELWTTVMLERKLALLIKFSDGSFMPFHVHRCVGGNELTGELYERLAGRMDRDYQYTPQEVKALRSADWNRLVKPRGTQTGALPA